jgi:uncharacterized protein (UPF0147 family)
MVTLIAGERHERSYVNKLIAAAAIVVLMAALPADAQRRASSAEQQYCEALSNLYMRYVGNPETEPRNVRRNDAEAEEALSQCRHGNSAVSIPVLEHKLTDNRITLPAHP